MLPLDGTFCLGGVCWDVIIAAAVVGAAVTWSGLEVLGLQSFWSVWLTLGEH